MIRILSIVVLAALVAGCGDTEPVDRNPGGAGGGSAGSGGAGGAGGVGPWCGDGVRDSGEECDEGPANSDVLADACRSDCSEPACGDSVVDSGEACDDGNTVDGDGCSASCVAEPRCGNGVVDGVEDCDGEDLAGTSCLDLGHVGGTLACSETCTFDQAACLDEEICDNGLDDDGNGAIDCADEACECPRCGDDAVNQPSEECDGTDLRTTCADLGFPNGATTCTETCTVDASDCRLDEACLEPGDEDGDGAADCDDSDCSDIFECPTCGNGIVQLGEHCEGTPRATCMDVGFDAGTIGCLATCMHDTSGCRHETCGDGFLDGAEVCDDGNLLSADGCSATCTIEGDDCATLVDLSSLPGWQWDGNSTGFVADFTAGCGTVHGLPDAVASFTAPAAGSYEFVIDSAFPSKIWAWDGACATPGVQLACAVPSVPGGMTRIGVDLASGQTVWLATASDDSSNATGPFIITAGPVVCGDGIVGGNEACDDGNTTSGDGCSASCRLPGDACDDPFDFNAIYDAAAPPTAWSGMTIGMGNEYSSGCSLVDGIDGVGVFTAPTAGRYHFEIQSFEDVVLYVRSSCTAATDLVCVDAGGALAAEAAFLDLAAMQTVYLFFDTPAASFGTLFGFAIAAETCGDDFVIGAEECDDGNTVGGDGCEADCTLP